jgi:hypothetical protein
MGIKQRLSGNKAQEILWIDTLHAPIYCYVCRDISAEVIHGEWQNHVNLAGHQGLNVHTVQPGSTESGLRALYNNIALSIKHRKSDSYLLEFYEQIPRCTSHIEFAVDSEVLQMIKTLQVGRGKVQLCGA